jgi:hypothetical protein
MYRRALRRDFMANCVHVYKDRDIKRAVRGSGLNRIAVEVDPKTGNIRIITGTESASETVNPWDAATDKVSAA